MVGRFGAALLMVGGRLRTVAASAETAGRGRVPPQPRSPGATGSRARSLGRQGAQGTVEFALVFGLFLVMLFAIVDAWIWTIESNAADAAVEQGIGVALAAPPGSPTSTQGDVAGVYQSTLPLLRQPMFGTSVDPWKPPLGWPAGTCPDSDYVADHQGVGHVDVCAAEDGAGHVTVAVSGYAYSFIPPGISAFTFRSWGLPIEESASVNAGVYAGP
ncbi:MAG TPA: TadE family protein [Candidatus Binatia bacterium]|nr:TadE family protein [Candidatus Binatia bacterium]